MTLFQIIEFAYLLMRYLLFHLQFIYAIVGSPPRLMKRPPLLPLFYRDNILISEGYFVLARFGWILPSFIDIGKCELACPFILLLAAVPAYEQFFCLFSAPTLFPASSVERDNLVLDSVLELPPPPTLDFLSSR